MPDPRLETRLAVAERHRVAQDLVEAMLVALVPDDGVFEERKRHHVGGRELVAKEIVAASEQRLEERQRSGDLTLERLDPVAVGG